ncbi:putative N-acetylmuramoyl-L-alanine amidase [Escherichia coli]|nr:putative N-acetylmuramoyl-L-alanine amidase [Escherichia coli]
MRRFFWLVAAALLLAGCAGEKGIVEKEGYQLDTRRQAQAAYPRIKVLVIHYTADDFDSSLATLTDKQVSSHYLVPAVPPRYNGKPRIWQLVPEQELAWHAGISAWRGATRLNDTSIGIELENRGWQKSAGVKYFAPFEPAQIQALIPLAKDIIARYHIKPENVVAHADIAPQRKDDPGPLFPWQQLAQQGIGAWPDAQRVNFYLAGRAPHTPVDTASLLELLARYGYDVKPDMTPREQRRVIMAFQMHFRRRYITAKRMQKLRRLPKHCWRNTGRISAAVFRGRVARRQFSRYLHPG